MIRSIPSQDLNDGDVLVEDGARYLVLDVHDRVSGVYVSAKRDEPVPGGDAEFHFHFDEPVSIAVLA